MIVECGILCVSSDPQMEKLGLDSSEQDIWMKMTLDWDYVIGIKESVDDKDRCIIIMQDFMWLTVNMSYEKAHELFMQMYDTN